MHKNQLLYIGTGSAAFGIMLGILLIWQPLPTGPQATQTIAIDQPAPNFELVSLDGKPIALSDLRGKAIILNFWATWCGPCRAEMPAFEDFARRYDDAVVFAVNADSESASEATTFIETVNAPTVLVGIDPTRRVRDLYRVVSLPTTYFIDHSGIVRTVRFGEVTSDDLDGFMAFLERETNTVDR
jgi:thiol-disulfide isomerase/thioredoxin